MKKIEWLLNESFSQYDIPCPKPASHYVPDWYKKIPKLEKRSINENKIDQYLNKKTIKTCTPFLDSFLTGYIQETWCDIYIDTKSNSDSLDYAWSLGPEIMSHREKVSSSSLIDTNLFYNQEFIWKSYWMPKMPKGYSMIFTHPFNRTDLPFYNLTGVIDSDKFYGTFNNKGSFPFFIKKDFLGLIPAGTPMYQMIPIKREGWRGDNGSINKYKQISTLKFFLGGYKKLYWQHKDYK